MNMVIYNMEHRTRVSVVAKASAFHFWDREIYLLLCFFADITSTLSVFTLSKLENCLTVVGIKPATFGLLVQCSTN